MRVHNADLVHCAPVSSFFEGVQRMAMCSLTSAKILCTEDIWFLVSFFVDR
jgi:hypothetical protein